MLQTGQHALRELKNVAEALDRVGRASKYEEVRVWRRCHANFAPNSREEIAKFLEIRRVARAKPACIRRASVVHSQRNVAEVDRVKNAFHSEKTRVWRRDLTRKCSFNVAPNSRERIAKFLKIFGALRAQKIACTRPAWAATRVTSSKFLNKLCVC